MTAITATVVKQLQQFDDRKRVAALIGRITEIEVQGVHRSPLRDDSFSMQQLA